MERILYPIWWCGWVFFTQKKHEKRVQKDAEPDFLSAKSAHKRRIKVEKTCVF